MNVRKENTKGKDAKEKKSKMKRLTRSVRIILKHNSFVYIKKYQITLIFSMYVRSYIGMEKKQKQNILLSQGASLK